MTTLILNSELQGGKYTIKKVLGQGGFGITYLAEQAMLDRQVAIKEFFLKDYCERDGHTCHVTLGTQSNKETADRFLQKFIKEARTISRLHHPGIIEIYDIFMENNTAYYVMEYIEGESLGDIVKSRGALPEKEALRYIRETAEALAYIHSRNINHLDIKPNNLMLRRREGKIVVIDFGVSKQYDENTNESTTTTPVGISLGYSPAEQYQKNGVSTFSPQSDIYSLGATLYKLLTGVTPPESIEVARMNGKLQIKTSISKSTKNAITKALQFHTEDRPQTVLEFLSIIEGKALVESAPNVEEEETIHVVARDNQKAEAMAAERERLMKAAMAKAEKEKAEAESKAREEAVRRAREDAVREEQINKTSNNNPTTERAQSDSNEDNGYLGRLGRMIRISVFIIGVVVVLTFVVASIISHNDNGSRGEPQNSPEEALAVQQPEEPLVEQQSEEVSNYKIKFSDGSTAYYWTGPIVDGLPNGKGTITYAHKTDKDGRYTFEGNVSKGLRTNGTLLYMNGNSYVGSFDDDKFARGRLVLKNDGVYFYGLFKDNQPWDGKWYLIDDNTLYSEMKEGQEKKDEQIQSEEVSHLEIKKQDGTTAYYWTGPMVDGLPEGKGKITYAMTDKGDRYTFEGNVSKGLRAHGTLLYKNGNSYVGSFDDDKFARGRLTLKNDGVYFYGTFKDNQPWNGKWYFSQDNSVYSTVDNGNENPNNNVS